MVKFATGIIAVIILIIERNVFFLFYFILDFMVLIGYLAHLDPLVEFEFDN
jgi:hypothetical protein